MVSPPQKREGVKVMVEEHRQSERHACQLADITRSSVRYLARGRHGETELRTHIRRLAAEHRMYGCGQITFLLRREGVTANKKRIHRLWKAEGLQQPRRTPRKRWHGPKGEVLKKAQRPNHVWTYDLMEDRTERGHKLRILTVLDEYTRESLATRVERSMPARRVLSTLEWLVATRGAPEHIRSDNGPEFIAKAVRAWLAAKGCETIFITPGSPWENPFIESFNGKLRTECLNRHVFTDEEEARKIIERWRREYNEFRPHGSLGGLSPAMYAAQAASPLRPTASALLPPNSTHAILSF
jgi:transposase InsO family protein